MVRTLSLIVILLLSSCKEKPHNKNLSHSETLHRTDEIVIQSYRKYMSDYGESFTPIGGKKFHRNNIAVLQSFKSLFNESEKTDYCCCPDVTYSISFCDNNETINSYHVDTVEFQNKVRIYKPDYQYSYLIEKQLWKRFMEKFIETRTNR